MSNNWVYPWQIISDVYNLVAFYGKEAFPHNGRAHFYSGPKDKIKKNLVTLKYTNHDLAKKYAKENAVFIIFEKNPLIKDKNRVNAALLPWKELSRLYVLSLFGDLTTDVCGASRQGVYYNIELPLSIDPKDSIISPDKFWHLLLAPRDKDIETINVTEFSKFTSIYKKDDWEKAHRLICLTEQRRKLHEAMGKTNQSYVRELLKLASKEITVKEDVLKKIFKDSIYSYEVFLTAKERYELDRNLIYGKSIKDTKTRQGEHNSNVQIFAQKVISAIVLEAELNPDVVRRIFVVPKNYGTMGM